MKFQDLILALQNFWAAQDCVISQPYDIEVGAGTMNPHTFLKTLGPEPWNVAYVEPSRRPVDGRYGENPFRVHKHYQFQVILKPSPDDIQERYLKSLAAMGIVLEDHDIRFEEDNWEAPTLGAWGVGWQVLLDGMEITQFTYFQQVGGIDTHPVSVEITYGIERLCMFLGGVDNIFDLPWSSTVTYGDARKREEYEFSKYCFESADIDLHKNLFDMYENEAYRLLDENLPLVAYDYTLKCSHTFNVLDSRGAVSTTQRPAYIARVRKMACAVAEQYVALQEGVKHG
ncbi:glycine--tRNA ligase subunit alpha [Sulfidibacter corallicola]|uniref:Glycine--tRNA ligase alpha subunit n=1 Tax=Sulfidibacter corallicola TaxID=2818388 RepID=A0A8A4TDJ2_SULCO|nr:glycine--tRNA ligase subunit alpha [Sulfidibacter corallicola]QTD47637.1 glycine--tRNA ligase subunit alpha [Sulfidibacter corallicola]